MLVRLAPGAEYPPHTHAGVEELHMLQGELIVDDKKLYPGDYLRSEPGTVRSSGLERDRLHLRSPHVDQRHASLTFGPVLPLLYVPLPIA